MLCWCFSKCSLSQQSDDWWWHQILKEQTFCIKDWPHFQDFPVCRFYKQYLKRGRLKHLVLNMCLYHKSIHMHVNTDSFFKVTIHWTHHQHLQLFQPEVFVECHTVVSCNNCTSWHNATHSFLLVHRSRNNNCVNLLLFGRLLRSLRYFPHSHLSAKTN